MKEYQCLFCLHFQTVYTLFQLDVYSCNCQGRGHAQEGPARPVPSSQS